MIESKRDNKLVDKLTERLKGYKQLSYKEDDITIVNPKYVTQDEKDDIYRLWEVVKNNTEFLDEDLGEAVKERPLTFSRYNKLSKNFPNLVANLREHGIDETIIMCASRRKMVSDIINHIKTSSKKFDKDWHEQSALHGIFCYIIKVNPVMSTQRLSDLANSFDQLSIYNGMIDKCPELIEELYYHGFIYVADNLLGLKLNYLGTHIGSAEY